jgi:uncharacterized protein DUF4404
MDPQELRAMLEQLHAELGNAQSVDEGEREMLKHLMADIQTVLARSGEGAPPHYQPLIQRLGEAVKHFEASHPTLTLLMGRALDTLSNAGV